MLYFDHSYLSSRFLGISVVQDNVCRSIPTAGIKLDCKLDVSVHFRIHPAAIISHYMQMPPLISVAILCLNKQCRDTQQARKTLITAASLKLE